MEHTTKKVNLKNGSNGVLVDIPDIKVFYCQLIFRGGDLICPEGKPEVAHFMEHMASLKNAEYDKRSEFVAAFF